MSVEAMTWVLSHSETSGTDKVVLIGIASHADRYGENAWPSVDTLAHYANIDRRGAQRALTRLRDAGAITVVLQAGGSRRQRADRAPNLYTIPAVRGWAESALGRGGSGDAPQSDGAALVTPRGGSDGAHGAALEPREPSLETSIQPSLENMAVSPPIDPDAMFDQFWSSYPSARRIDRKKCRTRFLSAMSEKPAPDILAGFDRWLAHWRGADARFIPQSITWLNQRRWETDPGPPAANRAKVAGHPSVNPEGWDRNGPEGIVKL